MRRRAFILAYVLVLGGCGSKSGVDPAADDLAGAVCDLAFRCCTRGEVSYLLGPYVFADDCADRLVATAEVVPGLTLNLDAFAPPGMPSSVTLPNLTVLDRAVRTGRTIVNRDRVDECLTYIRGLSCGMLEVPEDVEGCVPPTPPIYNPCSLSRLFEGKGGNGDECASPGLPIECQPGFICATIDGQGLEGTCVELGDEGDPCFADFECRSLREADRTIQLYCSQLDGTCQRPSLAGETCLYADREEPTPSGALLIRCDVGLSCDALSDTCVEVCKRGAACADDQNCDDLEMLTCISGRCDLLRDLGQPCGADDDCVAGLRCEPNPVEPELRVCTEKLANGQPCATFTGSEDCQSGWCNLEMGECAPQKPPGSLCPDGDDAQCQNGYCESGFLTCFTDTDCVGSGACNEAFGRCEYYCIAYLADGSPCDAASECLSDACVAGVCRTLPLPEGAECDFTSQCETEFCNTADEPPVCATLPLADGRNCFSSAQCSSRICFEGMCNPGLPEGQICNDITLPPCHADLYCTEQLDPPKCVPRFDAGEICEGAFQCRGDCVLAFGRMVCDETPPLGQALCDGAPNGAAE